MLYRKIMPESSLATTLEYSMEITKSMLETFVWPVTPLDRILFNLALSVKVPKGPEQNIP
jgi:hypothetical protein